MKQLLFLQTILVFFSHLAFSQECENEKSVPSELFRGRYEEPDMRLGHPYTMFNKNSPNWSLEFALENIRVKIKNGINPFKLISQFEDGEYARIYKNLYNYATTNEPAKCPKDDKCSHPAWVKNNAIIYIVGLKYESYLVDNVVKDTFYLLTETERNQFAERANNGLKNLNPDIIPCRGGGNCKYISLKAFDLIQYLESYDLLKGSGYIGDDRNQGIYSPRNKLREFARNRYVQSEDVINSFYC